MEDKYSRKICLATNYNCNLNCIYCYEREKQNINFNAEEALPILKELLSTKTEYGTKIKLHGGEPFLAFSEIRKVCEGLWNVEVADYFHFHITTNGTLVHGEIQKWLTQHKDKVTVKLSLDGDRLSHNTLFYSDMERFECQYDHNAPNLALFGKKRKISPFLRNKIYNITLCLN